MKKTYLLFSWFMVILIGLTGCSRQIKLESALANNANIKSYAYDITVGVDSTGRKTVTNSSDPALSPQISSVLSSGKVSFNFNGKILETEDRTKFSSAAKVSTGGVSFEIPIYMDSASKKVDFDLFVGLPDMLKGFLGPDFASITNLYLSSKDLDDYMKANSTAEAYKSYEDSITKSFDAKSSKRVQVMKDMGASFNSYLTKNSAKVKTFSKLDKESVSKNGIYTIKLTKDDIKAIAADYYNNETYLNNFKAAIKEVEDLSASNPTSSGKAMPSTDLDAKELIDDFNKEMDTIKSIDLALVFTIEDSFVTKTNIKAAITNEEGVGSFTVDSKLSDINKVTSIDAPDKTSDKTMDIIKYINKVKAVSNLN